MNTFSPRQIRLLVVEPNPDVQGILRDIFLEEGYDTCFATSMQEALPLLEEEVFQVVLADLFMGRSRHSLTEAHILRRRALPTPMALMTTQNLSSEAAQREGFAFLIRKPFDLEELLADIACALQRPLTPEQQCQALLLERYFAAMNERDWEALVDLCTEDVIFYQSARAALPSACRVTGKAAFSAYIQYATEQTAFRFEEEMVYARRKGLAVRYIIHVIGANSVTEHRTGAVLFHFAGERISRIGVSLGYAPLVPMRQMIAS